jgi:hypothetical protein
MAYLEYSIGPITAWSGTPLVPTVEEEDTVQFDNLRLPLVSAEPIIEVVKSSGRDFHGLRIRETDSQPITATATRFFATVAEGFTLRDTLRAFKPVAGDAGLGVWIVYADVGGGPYDVLGVDFVRPFQFVLTPVGTIASNATVRFDYAIRLKQRVTPTEATP